MIPVLIIVNLNTSDFQWFWFPMLGWGLGLTFHAFETFGYGKSWEERKIQEILEKENRKKTHGIKLAVMETKEEYERYQKASKKVQEIKGFYSHLIAYLFVIPIIAFVNIKYTPEHFRFFYPMIGWGIGVLFHGIGVFGTDNLFGRDWEKRKIKKFMEEEKNKNKYL